MATPPDRVYAGTIADFDDSMAQEIEIALAALLGPLPSTPQRLVNDRRKLFIAIAKGVIKHLEKHRAAFEVTFDIGLGPTTANTNIKVRN